MVGLLGCPYPNMLVGSAGAAAGRLRVGLHPAAAGNDHLLQEPHSNNGRLGPLRFGGGGKITYGYSRCRLASPARGGEPSTSCSGTWHGFTGKGESEAAAAAQQGACPSPPRVRTLWWHRTTVPQLPFPAFRQTTAAPGPRRLLIWRGTPR